MKRTVPSREAATTETEETLLRIWRSVLEFDAIGLDESFFAYGNSLQAVQICSQIQEAWDIEIDVLAIFESETVARLAEEIEKRRKHPLRSRIPELAHVDLLDERPLSSTQERIWFLEQLVPGRPAYNLPMAFWLEGPLCANALHNALSDLIARHDSLRTTFHQVDGRAVQKLNSKVEFALRIHDLRGAPEARSDAVAQASELARQHFDLANGPLVRAELFRTRGDEHLFFMDIHHIISDGWSRRLLHEELAILYEARLSSKPNPLPTPRAQYGDYVAWEYQRFRSESQTADVEYWRQQLMGLEPLNLPTDRPYPSVSVHRANRYSFTIPQASLEKLSDLAAHEHTTLFVCLLAAFQALLMRYSGQSDIAVGVPVLNRRNSAMEGMVGPFLNTVAMRTDLREDPSFAELVQRTHRTAMDAHAHDELPFERLVSELQPQRDLRRHPLVQVIFQLLQLPVDHLELSGVRSEAVEIARAATQCELEFLIVPNSEGLLARFDYSTDLFDEETVARISRSYLQILEAVAEDASRPLSSLPLLSEAERRMMLFEWNATGVEYSEPVRLEERIRLQAARTPQATAVETDSGRLSYAELDERANQLAHLLRRGPREYEPRYVVCMERSPELVVALLGVLKAGGCYVPIDPEDPSERIASLIHDIDPMCIITQGHLSDRLCKAAAPLLILDPNFSSIDAEKREAFRSVEDPDALAYIIFTSGSTGRPKGVEITHRGICNRIDWMQSEYALDPEDRVLQKTPFTFDVSVWEFFWPLMIGARLILARPGGHRDAEYLRDLIVGKGVTHCHFVPSMLEAFLQTPDVEACRSLQRVFCSGEALQARQVKRAHERLKADLFNLYGPTEASVDVTAWSCRRGVDEDSIPIGLPIANTQIHILDPQLEPVPIGVAGELYIGGVGLARGYWRDPERTAERFIANPFSSHASSRLYRSGDLARYRPDGCIEFLGRTDDQVKIRGHRIEPGEVEQVLLSHSSVREAIVIARRDLGNLPRLVAYVVLVPDAPEEAIWQAELDRRVRAHLPEFMRPSHIEALKRIPVTRSGKLDRSALPRPLSKRPARVEYLAPRTSLEKEIAGIWRELLGVDDLGIHDDFFALGGESLLAVRLITELAERCQLRASLQMLFERPTVAGLAGAMAEAGPPELTALPSLMPQADARFEPYPLTDTQQAYWIGRLQDIELGNVSGHLYLELEIADFELPRFRSALDSLIERHDMLRAFIRPDGMSCVLPEMEFCCRVHDLSTVSAKKTEAMLEEIRAEMSHQVIPSDRAPLWDLRICLLSDGRARLHWSFDAIILDGRSLFLFFRDLAALYETLNGDLPALELSFRDYVLAVEEARSSPAYARSLAYWQERAPLLPSGPELPLARAPSEIEQPRFSRRHVQIDGQAWCALKGHAADSGITASGLLLTAFCEILATWSKSSKFTLNLTTFGRLPIHPNVNNLLGDFTHLTLLGVDLSQRENFRKRARRLQSQLWQDLEHRQVSAIGVLRERTRLQGQAPHALAPVVFTSTLGLNHEGDLETGLQQLGADVVYSISQTPQVWLDHQVWESEGSLHLNWDVVEELFPAGMLDAMFESYVSLLKRLAQEAGAWEQNLRPSLVPYSDLRLQSAINANEKLLPPGLLQQYFEAQASAHPEAVALIVGDQEVSYGALEERANRLGHALRAWGVQPGELCAVVTDKSLEQCVAVLGVLKAGGAYLPIDPELPELRVHEMLQDGQVKLALTRADFAEALRWPESVGVVDVEDPELANYPSSTPSSAQEPHDLAYVIYTSGSTGSPKGVMIEHASAVNTIVDVNRRFGIDASDRVFAISALSFDLSVWDFFGTWAAGGTVILPETQSKRDPARWSELARRHGVTVWNSVPTLMELWVEYEEGLGRHLPASLRTVMLSGDWIPINLPPRICDLGEQVEVIGMGGATEASIWSVYHRIDGIDPSLQSIPYGVPLANQRIYVLDDQLGTCPAWVPGELYLAGNGLARGYWNDDAKTAQKFVIHPASGERLYRTGDWGRLRPEGWIEFMGREDSQVKVGGFRIELSEIECALLDHPGVQASVAVVSGERFGERRLIAYYVPVRQSNLAASPEELELKTSGRALRDTAGLDGIELAATPDRGTSIARRSTRTFTIDPVEQDRLAALLATLQASELEDLPKYRYGSAGSLYPIQTYLLAKRDRIQGVPAGSYYYHPMEHRLVKLDSAARLTNDLVGSPNRLLLEGCAFAILLVARMDAIRPVYGERLQAFCLLEAGAMAQALETTASQLGLGLCQLGDLEFSAIEHHFELEEEAVYLHALVGGLPRSDDAAGWSRAEPEPSELELRRYLAERLPDYMVPTRLVQLEKLPLTGNGKVDRGGLATCSVSSEEPEFAAARSPLERTLAEIWCDLLEIESLGIDQNVFRSGATSLTAVRLATRLSHKLGGSFPLTEVFRNPTIRSLAESLEGDRQLSLSRATEDAREARAAVLRTQQLLRRSKNEES